MQFWADIPKTMTKTVQIAPNLGFCSKLFGPTQKNVGDSYADIANRIRMIEQRSS